MTPEPSEAGTQQTSFQRRQFETFVGEARDAERAEQYPLAIELLERALDLAPGHFGARMQLASLANRTGRIDRIGAKVELCGQSIHVYIPYIAETQDEKMYRVVMDRERWFSVVMGERYKADTRTTEKLAQRVPLPPSLANELAFRLEVLGSQS